jgi:hypothetical protein
MRSSEGGRSGSTADEGTRAAASSIRDPTVGNGSIMHKTQGSDELLEDSQMRHARQVAFDIWVKSPERRGALRAIAAIVGPPGLFGLVIGCLGYFFRVRTIGGHPYYYILIGAGGITFMAGYASTLAYVVRRKRFIERRVSEQGELQQATPLRTFVDEVTATKAVPGNAETNTNSLQTAVLWADTVERLDRYHKLVTNQADTSYLMAQLAAVSGFLILLSAAIAAVFAHTNLASGVVGGLGALGAGIATYIGKTFQRSYEQANSRLLAYFQQPLDLSRILISKSLLDQLGPKAKDEAVLIMIETAVSGGKWLPERPASRRPSGTDDV